MGNFFQNILDYMKLSDDDDGDYAEYVNEKQEREQKRKDKEQIKQPVSPASSSVSTQNSSRVSRAEESSERSSEPRRNSVYAMEDRKAQKLSERTAQSKVVPIRSAQREMGLCIIKPTAFGDCQDISDMLLNGRAIVINLEGFDDELSQRVMDFVSGTVYAIRGRLHPISKRIYIVSPDNIDISGDYLEMMSQNGVEAPTISKDF